MEKKKLIVSYKNLPPDALEALNLKYPTGYQDYVFKVNKTETDFFYAVTVDTETASYLVKVEVIIDKNIDDAKLDSLVALDNSVDASEDADFTDDSDDDIPEEKEEEYEE